ncbi:hypothetical protein [Rhodanobacter sp. C01]|uniref:hypothetical protein n=1 Tax=Rhodanobacter sp. C01 TaxID=1945856 RepID=UPI00098456C6|nr:hypothetical protein [Rhodanobacter sp. C01]OOG51584.1 hypothetical protein B0E50_00445 [Rhodanobacter sp. C01]
MKTRTLIFLCVVAICLTVAFLGYQAINSHSTSYGVTVPVDNSPATNGTTDQDARAQITAAPAGTVSLPVQSAVVQQPAATTAAADSAQDMDLPAVEADGTGVDGHPLSFATTDSKVAWQIAAKNGSKLMLTVNAINHEGYPVYALTCANGRCSNETLGDQGTVQQVSIAMTDVRQVDISRYSYKCDVICTDNAGNIIGRPSPYPPSQWSKSVTQPLAVLAAMKRENGDSDIQVSGINQDGFPIYDALCGLDGQCHDSAGKPQGTVKQVADQLEAVDPQAALDYHLTCAVFCSDALSNVVGQPSL